MTPEGFLQTVAVWAAQAGAPPPGLGWTGAIAYEDENGCRLGFEPVADGIVAYVLKEGQETGGAGIRDVVLCREEDWSIMIAERKGRRLHYVRIPGNAMTELAIVPAVQCLLRVACPEPAETREKPHG